ncbi:transcriptional regulator [Actinomadura craniellae]|uniref:Transcriptional regulator n=1 Tax=Actinomadura craniellae TaxID=2231787 RepID=A0A365H6U5_9ACTN|nr:helix-turn-helix transcriptional regulator [Actinomadura craniellae]RAY14759.1 transcriptional regulator [Actinomadura craniellae]
MPGPGNVGERVRNLRLTRRLSQAQLAGHDLSDSYISLIESGKRTPTPAVLRLLAERLGCTPEYLAEGIEPEQRAHLEVRERHARFSLIIDDAEAALAAFDDVLARSDDAELIGRARWGRARSLEALHRTEAAISLYEDVREQAERDPTRTSWLPVVIALARCYHSVGDLGQSISLAERALDRLAEFGLHMGAEYAETGRILLLAYTERSDSERAHELGRRLFQDDEPDSVTVAAAYQSASEEALLHGAVGDAFFFADRAISVGFQGRSTRIEAQLQLAGARALLRGVPSYTATDSPAAAQALALLRKAAPELTGADSVECALETARALVLLGEPEQAIGAVDALSEPNGAGPGSDLRFIQARLVLAQARLAQDDQEAALTVLRSLAGRLDALADSRSAAHVFRELGELYEAAGDGTGATVAYRRALEAAGLRPAARPRRAACDVTA